MAQPRERKNNRQGQWWKRICLTTVSKPIHHDGAAPNIPSKFVIKIFSQTCKIALLNLICRSLQRFTIHPAETLPCTQKPFYDRTNDAKTFLHFSTSASSEMKIHSEMKTTSHTCFYCFSNHEEIFSRIWFQAAEFGDEKHFLTSTKICRRLID